MVRQWLISGPHAQSKRLLCSTMNWMSVSHPSPQGSGIYIEEQAERVELELENDVPQTAFKNTTEKNQIKEGLR